MQNMIILTIHVIPERMSAHISLLSPSVATLPYRSGLMRHGGGREELYGSGRKGVVIALVRVTGSLLNRRPFTGHPPLGDPYESSTLPSWSLRSTHLTFIRGHNNWLGTIIAPGAMSTYGFANISTIGDVPRPNTVLVPAPQSQWPIMHASTMMPSHATLPCGSLLAITLIAVGAGRADTITDNYSSVPVRYFTVKSPWGNSGKGFSMDDILISPRMGHRGSLLPQRLDGRSYRIISLGFLPPTLGILPGAVWANEAWGYHWNRDPKETRAPITWPTFAIHPHTGATGAGWQGEESAIVASPGFLATRIRHLGVNSLGEGPHSHGWFIQRISLHWPGRLTLP